MTPRTIQRWGVGILVSATATVADAHAPLKGAGFLYSGLLHPLTALEEILPLMAFSILVGQQLYAQRSEWMAGVFIAAFVGGASAAWWIPSVPGITVLNLASSVVLGLLVLLAWSPPPWVAYSLSMLFGLSHGYANGLTPDLGIPPLPFTFGLAASVVLIIGYVSIATLHALARNVGWMTIAVRVSGSWIAAVGILVMANGLRPHAT